MNAADMLSKARTQLLMSKPFFGTLALRLTPVPDKDLAQGTMGTDGTHLFYDPEWVEQRTLPQLRGLWAHEVMHNAIGHPWRMGTRDMARWNVAADMAINARLKADGLELPDGGVDAPPGFEDKAAEECYKIVPAQPPGDSPKPGHILKPGQGQTPGQGQGQGQPGQGQGQADGPMTQEKWKIAAEQAAMVARKAGTISGDLDRMLKDSRETATDWRTVLRDFLAPLTPNTPTWSPCNRRYASLGLTMPGKKREDFPRIGVAVDTSESVNQKMLQVFAREISTILAEVRPERIDVVYCDSRVRGFESFTPDDGDVTLNASGGGGTRFQPALDHFNDDPEGPPAAVIYLTDLAGPAPDEPAYPVLWAVPKPYDPQNAPFGRSVSVDTD